MIGIKEKSGGRRPGAGRRKVHPDLRREILNDFRIRADLIAWLKTQKPRGGRLIEDALIHCYSFNPDPPAVAHIAYRIEEDRRRLQRVLDSVPAKYPLLKDQIKGQLKYAQPGYHLAWHILEYGVDLYHMKAADMELIEDRINYATITGGSPDMAELQKMEELDIMKKTEQDKLNEQFIKAFLKLNDADRREISKAIDEMLKKEQAAGE